MALSQEDEWKQMVKQDPHSGSVTGDSGHGTMTASGEDEPIDNIQELIGAVGGVNESVATEHLSDVEWRDDDPLFVFDNDNVTKPQTPATASTPVSICEEEDKAVSSVESPVRKRPCFQESIAKWLSKTASICLEPNYNGTELVGFT